MDIICPKSPTVWDGNGFSPCFENMVLGFGGNVVTIAAVLYVVFARRKNQTNRSFRIVLVEKVFLHIVPALGACLSLFELLLLLKNSVEGYNAEYHECLFRCSQFVSWMVIILASNIGYWFNVLCNPVVCFWWIVKPLLMIPLLQRVISSSEAMTCIRELSSVCTEILFCLFINIIRAVHSSIEERKFDSLEDPLLSCSRETKEMHTTSLVCNCANFWHLLTFKFVNTMMVSGMTRQLDFDDLVELPSELIPSSCYTTLLSCWVDEQNKCRSHPSLFRVICYAYGWSYLRLGLLKILNDSIGFLGPLLLNKLIKFLQQE